MNFDFINSCIINLLLILMVLLSLAFLTLLERKLLGYIQIRKGPNKVSFLGIMQPFSDAIKLFSKELFLIKNSNDMFYLLSPVFSMMLMLMMWLTMPNYFNLYYLNLNLLLLLCFLSLSVYMMMISGWSSNSMYYLPQMNLLKYESKFKSTLFGDLKKGHFPSKILSLGPNFCHFKKMKSNKMK